MVDPLSYFLFQPVVHEWCNKGCGMCYPVYGIVHIKEPLLLIRKSSPVLVGLVSSISGMESFVGLSQLFSGFKLGYSRIHTMCSFVSLHEILMCTAQPENDLVRRTTPGDTWRYLAIVNNGYKCDVFMVYC